MSKAVDDESLKARITALKTRDALTGLYNRNHFIRLLDSALSQPSRGGARALLYLRPDNFGEIDQRFGPTRSDALLRQMAGAIREVLSTRCLLARFGGNAFLALVVREDAGEVKALAESLLSGIAGRLFEVDAESASITVSIGVAVLSPDHRQADDAISLAQAAARQARESGGNALHLEEPTDAVYREQAEVAEWAKRISTALADDGFRLVYQPIVRLDGSSNFDYDVLLRMLDGDREDILPGEFMPAAERAGLMPGIDRWVIRRAFGVAAARHAAGKRTRIFVRISEATLRDREFFGWLGLEALNHRLDRGSVVLQLTERTVVRCLPLVRKLLAACADLHLKLSLAISVPEAGCLAPVKQLQFDFLVLDGDFIKAAEPDMLDGLMSAAAENELAVIATRVESAADLARLYTLGVEYVSGFLVHEPEEEIVEGIQMPGTD